MQSDAERMNRVYLATYGRPGNSAEIQEGLKYLETLIAQAGSETETDKQVDNRGAAWSDLCHAMIISTEFLTHD